MLPELYTDISNTLLPVLSRDNVIDLLISKKYLIGADTDIGDIHPDIKRLTVNLVDDDTTSSIYINKEGDYCYDISSTHELEDIKRQFTHRNKVKRNAVLAESDWIELSPAVSVSTKDSYKAYRQYLRDIFNYREVSSFIEFPPAPSITALPLKSTLLSDVDVNKIRRYSPVSELQLNNWALFLSEWSNTNYNSNRAMICNLLKAYTGMALKEILD
jgi:hypothetical protein